MHVFFCLNNSSDNKWFDFKIPPQSICTTTLFPTCSLIGYLKPSYSNFIMFWPKGRCLAYNLTSLPTFHLCSTIFFITLWTWLGLPHPSIIGIPWCVCTHPINFMGIHFLRYVHGNEHTKTHDAMYNTLLLLRDKLASMWDENNYMHFF
jgi:hypothetical protein